MNTKKFSEAINELDDRYIATAIHYQSKKKKGTWMKWGTLAACLTLVIFAGTNLLPERTTQLPMLSISPTFDGMGFEGLMAYDISELVNANPWNEDMTITTLPVYSNPITHDSNGVSSGADHHKMQTLLLTVADRLGLPKDKLTITDNAPDEETKQMTIDKFASVGNTVPDGYFDPTALEIETDDLTIRVDLHLEVSISFKSPITLPEKYPFTEEPSYEELSALAEYLKSEYKDLMGFENPQPNISGGDYDIYFKQNYSIEFFDAAGSETEQIINYHFNRAQFYCHDGALSGIRLYQPDLSKKLGDYPIITSKEAYELLSQSNYMTSVPYELPGMEYVKKAELVYRTVTWEPCYMPYYKFYVELPEEETDGLKTYGAYYVPAVSGEYISDMTVWDGSFN